MTTVGKYPLIHQRKVRKMTTVGKFKTRSFALILFLFAFAGVANARGKEEYQTWTAKDKPGDGVAEVLLPDANTPMACRLEISVKGGPSCSKVMCKGEQVPATQSPQSMMAAKQIALSIAKSHYTHFVAEEINSKRSTDLIAAAIVNESGPNPGAQASNGSTFVQTVREQASALIKGFAVIEDGFEKIGNGQVAYVIGGVSCLSQIAADNMSAGNKRDNSTPPAGSNSGTKSDAGPATVPARRRAGSDQL